MSAEDTARYRRAKAIAFEMLEEPPERRAQRIEAESAGDDALRDEILWLIEAAERPDADAVPRLLGGIAGLGIQPPTMPPSRGASPASGAFSPSSRIRTSRD